MRYLFKVIVISLLVLVMSISVFCNELQGKASLLIDYGSGRVLFEDNSQEELGIASISKLMTLVLVLEALGRGEINLDDQITASPFAASKRGTRIWLEAGEVLTLEELLYAVAVGSANDAAVALAEFISGTETEFVSLMNTRAKELGLTNTNFVNCSGLSESDVLYNEMSAADIASLAMHAMKVPELMSFVSTYEYTMRSTTTKIPVLWNANKLLRRYYGVDGLKTGYTKEAGYCIVATAERDKLRLIAVTLGLKTEEEREKQARYLLDMGFRKYQSMKFHSKDTVVASLTCPNGSPEKINVVIPSDFNITVERGRELDLQTNISLEQNIVAPLKANTEVGELKVLYENEVVGFTPLVLAHDVEKASIFSLVFRLGRTMANSVH